MTNATKGSVEVHVLCLGLEPQALDLLSDLVCRCRLTKMAYDMEKLLEPVHPAPHLILCGPPPEGLATVEIAQMLSMQYAGVPLFFAAFKREEYDRKIFIKNGFTDAFVLPMDCVPLKRSMSEVFTQVTNGEIKSYCSVKLIDIEPGTALDFDVAIYLPSNSRYIRYSAAGDSIDKERLEKLRQHKMNAVYVTTDQMPTFYKYTANRLRQIGCSDTLSATEKKEKLETSVRDLMSGLFSNGAKEGTFEQGQNLLRDCREITKTFILDSPSANWYKRFLEVMGEMNSSHGHAANVSTYVTLFSIALGIGDPAEMAMAGLFHDVGLADVPGEIVAKREEERTKDGQELYKKHPEYSINILKRRKVVLSSAVSTAILQHHENFNGTGYPHGCVGSRTSKEAQILALADRFDYLTSVQEGKILMTPAEAIEHFRKQVLGDPGKMIFDPELLKKVLNLFPKEVN